jgi:hypothetical protein
MSKGQPPVAHQSDSEGSAPTPRPRAASAGQDKQAGEDATQIALFGAAWTASR